LDAYLAQTGTITADAIKMLENHTNAFYQSLLDWNKKFGTSIDTDIISKWELALSVIKQAQSASMMVNPASMAPGPNDYSKYTPKFDDGGWAGGVPKFSGDAVFGQLMQGERMDTPDMVHKFLQQTLPNIVASSTTNNNQSAPIINVPISIYGSPDKSTIELLSDKVFEKINRALQIQGHTRSGMAFSV
jgi:hypothetical protein